MDLEAGPTRPLYFSKRDAVSYFDCLIAPECVRGWFARPAIRAGELLDVMDSSSLSELARYVDFSSGSPLTRDTRLYPIACCWPMGFSWSSAVGQDVMLAQAAGVGLDDRYLLADDKPASNSTEVDEFYAVCTDDFMHWARSVPLACNWLASLDVRWGRSGISRKPAKDVGWTLRGTPIGCDFVGQDGDTKNE